MPESTPEVQPGALERVAQQLESPASPDTLAVAREPAAPTVPAASSAPAPVARPAAVEKSSLREDIEAALADEQLQRIYAGLPPATQGRFREEGAKLAGWIETAITTGKLILREVHRRIVAWLRIIPRVNRFFLIQEAKVKTDAILALQARRQ